MHGRVCRFETKGRDSRSKNKRGSGSGSIAFPEYRRRMDQTPIWGLAFISAVPSLNVTTAVWESNTVKGM
jgi:hypothetical protein